MNSQAPMPSTSLLEALFLSHCLGETLHDADFLAGAPRQAMRARASTVRGGVPPGPSHHY